MRPQNAFSVRNGSGLRDPSRCLTNICTLPSASSSCFLQAAERPTPSSKSLSESSSARSPFSSCSTMVSSFFRDSSKEAMHLLRGGSIGKWQHAGDHVRGHRVAPEGRGHLDTLHNGPYRLQHLARHLYAFAAGGIGGIGLRHAQHDLL